ncbi:MAG: rRNA pseudouridine synthase [Bacteroidales bacterium]|nr:rRNA pseudouridine synthase [Bacteroidales bacterium]
MSEQETPKRKRVHHTVTPRAHQPRPKSTVSSRNRVESDGTTRLNKYIAHAGICSRREADKLIAAGSVSVNGKVVTEMGFKVKPGDVVSYGGETLRSERKRYFILNKPKGFITTVDDPQERRTVMMLIDGACPERIYPVGRLDRATTGLLLFTNDGDLAKKLTHPSTGVYKIYHVELDKPVTRTDMDALLSGIELEDGMARVDDIQFASPTGDKRVVGVELHSGKNRIVRRMFEHLGYEVHKLDRVVFAGLTKKDLPRGRYRELTEKEVGYLKMI